MKMAKNIISRILQVVLVMVVLTTAVASAMQLSARNNPLCVGFPCSTGAVCGSSCYCAGGMCHAAN